MNIKRSALLLAVVLLHLCVLFLLLKTDALHKWAQSIGWQPTNLERHYDEMVSFHQRIDPSLPSGVTLFIGDSHTQGLAVSAVSPQSVNYGIGGDTTSGVLKRLPFYQSISDARAVVIAVGGNDLKSASPDQVLVNFKLLLKQIPTSVQVLVSAAFPVDETVAVTGGRNNANIQSLNALLAALAQQQNNVRFVSSYDKLANDQGQLDKRLHTGDGVHLNSQGYQVWIQDLATALNS